MAEFASQRKPAGKDMTIEHQTRQIGRLVRQDKIEDAIVIIRGMGAENFRDVADAVLQEIVRGIGKLVREDSYNAAVVATMFGLAPEELTRFVPIALASMEKLMSEDILDAVRVAEVFGIAPERLRQFNPQLVKGINKLLDEVHEDEAVPYLERLGMTHQEATRLARYGFFRDRRD